MPAAAVHRWTRYRDSPAVSRDDLERAIAYYRDNLGFELDFNYQSFYAGVRRDGFAIHLKHAPKLAGEREHRQRNEHLDAYISVSGIQELFSELQTRGARVIRPLEGRPGPAETFTSRIRTATFSASVNRTSWSLATDWSHFAAEPQSLGIHRASGSRTSHCRYSKRKGVCWMIVGTAIRDGFRDTREVDSVTPGDCGTSGTVCKVDEHDIRISKRDPFPSITAVRPAKSNSPVNVVPFADDSQYPSNPPLPNPCPRGPLDSHPGLPRQIRAAWSSCHRRFDERSTC